MSHRSDNSNHAFRVGQNVVAQWPGSKKQYRAKVIKNSPKYELEYEDGTRHKNVPVEAITVSFIFSIQKVDTVTRIQCLIVFDAFIISTSILES